MARFDGLENSFKMKLTAQNKSKTHQIPAKQIRFNENELNVESQQIVKNIHKEHAHLKLQSK